MKAWENSQRFHEKLISIRPLGDSASKDEKSRSNKGQGSRGAIAIAATHRSAQMPVFNCTKIIALSPFASAPKEDILDFVRAQSKASLIVLPGNRRNTPSPPKIQQAIRGDSVVFVEGEKGQNGRPAFIVTRSKISRMPSQIFAQKPTAADIDALAAALPSRTLRVGKRKAAFFICGELIAFNPDGTLKHKRKLDHDIIINPAHTLMGHWNHLGKKLGSLSRGSIAVYVTNNMKDRHLSSDVRIYKDGNLMKRHRGKNIAWSECRI